MWATASFSQNSPALTRPTLTSTTLAPFANADATALNPAWRLSGLPKSKTPLTEFTPGILDGDAVLAVQTRASYGVLAHLWHGPPPEFLSWRWLLAQPLAGTDIHTKAADDAALKVCVLFDQPLADVPFFQRASLALARAATGQNLPSATLCYVWDSHYPAGTHGANPYTARLRFKVLNGSESATGQWVSQRQRIADDFALLFGQESQVMPPIIAIAVGADSDNTKGSSLGYLSQLHGSP